ncbi:MAG TPA: hypothetical protein VGU61_22590 [Noviherbaspirillum sp.]|jgi:hypothetical protein|uniref:hypothetical protein n=1 Tax=Noviherbaspirillum sp. TaxID=1926288 RepID=UPI002DDCFC21|nr:hypothetical protein [Noviherbaspirillum sp.]HEV2613065.1 hypothetical protein [Noviherbaspirillum sp.]
MRTFPVRHLSAAWLALCAIPLSAIAQQAPQAPAQPPQLETLPEGEETAAAPVARQPREAVTTTEKRIRGGIVTDITVNSRGSTYHLKPNSPIGTTLPGDTESNRLRGPQWNVLQFDFGGARQPNAAIAPAPVPPPPPSSGGN